MPEWIIVCLGLAAQALFGFRLLVQLFVAEKSRQLLTPSLFWQVSLAASLLFLWYGFLRQDAVIILGQLVGYFIYIRNLQIKKEWDSIPAFARQTLIWFPVFLVLFACLNITSGFSDIFSSLAWGNPVFLCGVAGQLLLNIRFLYQWWQAEKQKQSFIPLAFWQISVIGAGLVAVYSVFHPTGRVELILLLSQALAMMVYVRNIFLFRKLV